VLFLTWALVLIVSNARDLFRVSRKGGGAQASSTGVNR
jgi:hypothetical protein